MLAIVLPLSYALVSMRVLGRLAAERGKLVGVQAVVAAFLLAEVVGTLLQLAMATTDDHLADHDLVASLVLRTETLAPWVIVDLFRARATPRPYEWPRARWAWRLLLAVFWLPWALVALGNVAIVAMRPFAAARAVRLAHAAEDYADECESPAHCHEAVARFVERVERGDVTFRALGEGVYLEGLLREGDEWISRDEAEIVFRYCEQVDANDGQPADPEILLPF